MARAHLPLDATHAQAGKCANAERACSNLKYGVACDGVYGFESPRVVECLYNRKHEQQTELQSNLMGRF